jgi:hypothetical protein
MAEERIIDPKNIGVAKPERNAQYLADAMRKGREREPLLYDTPVDLRALLAMTVEQLPPVLAWAGCGPKCGAEVLASCIGADFTESNPVTEARSFIRRRIESVLDEIRHGRAVRMTSIGHVMTGAVWYNMVTRALAQSETYIRSGSWSWIGDKLSHLDSATMELARYKQAGSKHLVDVSALAARLADAKIWEEVA